MIQHSSNIRQRRRLLLALPLLILPFLAMAFWALGGGKGQPSPAPRGLRLELPAPHLENQKVTARKELHRKSAPSLPPEGASSIRGLLNDPQLTPTLHEVVPGGLSTPGSDTPGQNSLPVPESREASIRQRLTQLAQLVEPRPARAGVAAPPVMHTRRQPAADIDRLEGLLQHATTQGSAPDPEMQQLQGMLDQILDIQHPERVTRRLQQQSSENERQVFPLHRRQELPAVTLLQDGAHGNGSLISGGSTLSGTSPYEGEPSQAFHGLNTHAFSPPLPANTLAADIRESQRLSTGATVRITLRQDAYLAGRLLPRGTAVFGTCRIRDERLYITVHTIRDGETVLPVALSAYDLDGMEGLFVPGLLRQQATTHGTDRLISQNMPPSPLAPTFGGQAVAAGMETAKRLLSGRIKRQHVTLPAGHRLLLLDRNAIH
ncbi:conjugative transposon protein TraM [Pontibacter sp. Tf4]|uniref:conjugative transposon protein TraM n=1 Tax=Pontibacter sp. Tf4 TaxID=2761620 RepID=UPI00162864B1|nr:conjugative transposon protein TraM [Pontibacter sp. Tf4]MBB6611818.1 conjugative transposon protein TraM [Pontibacter sp. Tf4]